MGCDPIEGVLAIFAELSGSDVTGHLQVSILPMRVCMRLPELISAIEFSVFTEAAWQQVIYFTSILEPTFPADLHSTP
jgi:hypothetical protein